jgi:hypothetical protein
MLGDIKITNSPLSIINLVIYSINWCGSKWEIIGLPRNFQFFEAKKILKFKNHQHKVVDSHT